MLRNKQTPTEETSPFKSRTMHPERKIVEKHIPQKLVIRGIYTPTLGPTNTDFSIVGGYVNYTINVDSKLLANLPDMCYVACESFILSEQFDGANFDDLLTQECYNITSPLFSSPNQYIPKRVSGGAGGGEYSSIIQTIPVNNSTYSVIDDGTCYVDFYGNLTYALPTGSTAITPTPATSINGSINQYGDLSVSSSVGGPITVGQIITGTGIPAGITIYKKNSSTSFRTNYVGTAIPAFTDGVASGTISTNFFGTPGSGQVPFVTKQLKKGFRVCWDRPVLQNQVGCFVVNKQMLNNQTIPFSITGMLNDVETSFYTNSSCFLQMTLVFYGLNDDERYSTIPYV